jgi:FixJ family two-component response regulator
MPYGSITVYIIDDDESIRKALKRLLRSAGYQAQTFASAEDFLDSTSARGQGCLILDIRLPGITGLDLQEKLASGEAKYQVIFITAHDNPQWQERARKAGAVAYLKKPFNEHSLLDAIRCACGKGIDGCKLDGRNEIKG